MPVSNWEQGLHLRCCWCFRWLCVATTLLCNLCLAFCLAKSGNQKVKKFAWFCTLCCTQFLCQRFCTLPCACLQLSTCRCCLWQAWLPFAQLVLPTWLLQALQYPNCQNRQLCRLLVEGEFLPPFFAFCCTKRRFSTHGVGVLRYRSFRAINNTWLFFFYLF